MHDVSSGYLRPFADKTLSRRNPHLWRSCRDGEYKPISVRDASVHRDLYTVETKDGAQDLRIETDLLRLIDNGLPPTVNAIASGGSPRYWQWRALSRFISFQASRTDRFFRLLRDEASGVGLSFGTNDPQFAMVVNAPNFERLLCSMNWTVCRNVSSVAFLTSDNPVAMWADRGAEVEGGVGFIDPDLIISLPLTPTILFLARHCARSRAAVLESTAETTSSFEDHYPLTVDVGSVDAFMAARLNRVTVSNAHEYVYSNRIDSNGEQLLRRWFFGSMAPVRRSDRKPIGTPFEHPEAD